MIAIHSFILLLLLSNHSVMSNSWRTCGWQHARLPCPSPSPGAWSNSHPLSQWWHPTISSTVVPFSSCFNLSQHQGIFKWVRPKYWNFSFSVSPSNEYSRLISCRMDWLDFFAVQGTLKSLLQYHNSKASILRHSAFFMVQLSRPYMTTGSGGNIALTIWNFSGKVMSLFLNMWSKLVIAFLPRSKCLLISWLQSPCAVILEPEKIKSVTVPLFLHLFAMKW